MNTSGDLRNRLLSRINEIDVYSSHEHFYPESEFLEEPLDFSFLFGYLGYALSAAGMPRDRINLLQSTQIGEDEKWLVFEPYLPKVSNIDYFYNITILLRDLFGIDSLSHNTYRRVGEELRELRKPSVYEFLMNKSGVRYALVDSMQPTPATSKYDPKYFGLIYRIKNEWFEKQFHQENNISSTRSLYDHVDKISVDLASRGVKGIKIPFAAGGVTLNFRKWSDADVASSLARLDDSMNVRTPGLRPLIDAVVFRFVRNAVENNMLVQVHTGMQAYAAGEPYLLKELIDAFPDAKFDLFHSGHPYHGQLAILASWFTNVYADLCWTAGVSKTLTIRILSEWLEIIPVNKILGFGSDFREIIMMYPYQKVVREVIADVLAEKVRCGKYSEQQAIAIAQAILCENLRAIIDRR